jgi:hypothetical protein
MTDGRLRDAGGGGDEPRLTLWHAPAETRGAAGPRGAGSLQARGGSNGCADPAGTAAPIFSPPWQALDDAALLRHLCAPRGVQLDLVVDAQECSPARMAALMQGRFDFNGEVHALGAVPDWLHNPSRDIEWHILLHKFYYAAGLGRDFLATADTRLLWRWVELVDSWIDSVPVDFIAADVTGRRVQNWIYALRGFVFHDPARRLDPPVPAAFVRRMLESLHAQVEFLCANLTPKRNHRTLELYAIFLAGVAFPEMARSAHWRAFALAQTVQNMQADLLPDGVHCEASTDYHHLALRNWLHVRTLAVRNGVDVPPLMDTLLERAFAFSLHVHKPDGVVPSLSDGDARDWRALLAQGAELFDRDDMRWVASAGAQGRSPRGTLAVFAHVGYSIVRSHWGNGPADFDQAQYLVLDHGPLGEGNHGHFDCLSFELAAFGRSLVVDPGRYTYSEAGDTNWRVHFRGTPAHNTVSVDGRHQTDYLPRPIKDPSRHAQGSVRHKISGPAPDARLLEAATAPALVLLHARAAGAAYDVVHHRVVAFLGGALWVVSDALGPGARAGQAPQKHDFRLHFQLHPLAQGRCTLQQAGGLQLHSPGLTLLQPPMGGQQAALVDGWVSERYGFKQPAPGLQCTQHGTQARFCSVLVPWQQQAPSVRLQTGSLAHDASAHTLLFIDHDIGGLPRREVWFHAQGLDAAAPGRAWTWHEGAAGTVRFSGRWLHLRRAVDGRLLGATSHAGARLHVDGQRIPLEAARCETPA